MSEAITYSEARQNLAQTMERVCDSHQPIIITRQKARSVVLMSLEDYSSILETAYLLQSPANAARLRASLAAADAGEAEPRELVDAGA
jgi:antitoxin YefM